MQHHRFDPPLEIIFPVVVIFCLGLVGVNMGSDSIRVHSPKSLSDESIHQDLVCAHMHSIARIQKIPGDIQVLLLDR